ncbi:Uncharacterized protein dnm_035730 [Desulfonema magnum]|uniref:Uncharacterized protein n=1 Tax=Desulfonema magnum TaxID=45655 RepID=A0A975GN95_9BACT|nr:Uncharacterized protein dnm_035730 [Desulfonema magnum]
MKKMDYFLNLYKKIKSELMLQYINSKKYAPEANEGWSIKKLNSLRNEFIHFQPKTWTIEVTGLPSICLDCLNVIRFCGWKSSNVLWHSTEYREKAENFLYISCSELENIKLEYEHQQTIN